MCIGYSPLPAKTVDIPLEVIVFDPPTPQYVFCALVLRSGTTVFCLPSPPNREVSHCFRLRSNARSPADPSAHQVSQTFPFYCLPFFPARCATIVFFLFPPSLQWLIVARYLSLFPPLLFFFSSSGFFETETKPAFSPPFFLNQTLVVQSNVSLRSEAFHPF